MFRYQKTVFPPFWAVALAALILGLPFVHSHPRTTHDDHSGLHTHTAVTHTVFSVESVDKAKSLTDDHDSETSVELFRTAIDLNVFTKRSPTEYNFDALTAARVSPDLSSIVIYSALTTKRFLLPFESTTTFPRFVRGPPIDLYS